MVFAAITEVANQSACLTLMACGWFVAGTLQGTTAVSQRGDGRLVRSANLRGINGNTQRLQEPSLVFELPMVQPVQAWPILYRARYDTLFRSLRS